MTAVSYAGNLDTLLLHDAFIRRLALSLVGDPHTADDLTQDVWVAALQGRSAPRGAPRAWLAGIGRRLAAHGRRTDARRRRREQLAAHEEAVPSVAEIAAREAVRRDVVEAVLGLDEAYRSVVLLRFFEDLPPRQIALRLGLPVATVKTRLTRAVGLLRARLDHEHGHDRRAWLAPLLGIARPRATRSGIATMAAAVSGTLLMSGKMKMAAALTAIAALSAWGSGWLDGSPSGTTRVPAIVTTPSRPAPVQSPAVAAAAAPAPFRTPVAEAAPPVVPVTTTGSVRATVTWHDGLAAAGLPVRVQPFVRYELARQPGGAEATTDTAGVVVFEGLSPGIYAVSVVGREAAEASGPATVVAGARVDVTMRLARGTDVAGVVVDVTGQPIAGATVVVRGFDMNDAWPLATTAADGTFHLRAVQSSRSVGAFATGYAPSPLEDLHGSAGSTRQLRFVLTAPDAALTVQVRGPDGAPLSGADVGAGIPANIAPAVAPLPDGRSGLPPRRRWVTTDQHGRAEIAGLPPGALELRVIALGCAPWLQRIDVGGGDVSHVEVQLRRAVVVTGTVTDRDGRRIADAVVECEVGGARQQRSTDERGVYRFAQLSPGILTLHVVPREQGAASTTLRGSPGDELHWDPVLEPGRVVTGRLIDDAGAPIANASVTARLYAPGMIVGPWSRSATTDADGRFTLTDCGPDRVVGLTVGIDRAWISKGPFRLADAPLVVRLREDDMPTCHIFGRVLAPDGTPATNISVTVQTRGTPSQRSPIDDPEGRFDSGPLVPGESRAVLESPTLGQRATPWRHLLPKERWDLGDVRFERAGTLVVTAHHQSGQPIEEATFRLCCEDGAESSIAIRDGTGRSGPLAPGQYVLHIEGDGFASSSEPCEVRSEVECRVDVTARPGVVVRLRLDLPPPGDASAAAGGGAASGMTLLPFDVETPDGRSVTSGAYFARAPAPICLAPGDYRLIVHSADRSWQGQATFVVPRSDGPVELTLQPR